MTKYTYQQKDNYRKLDCPKYNSRTSQKHGECKYNIQLTINSFFYIIIGNFQMRISENLVNRVYFQIRIFKNTVNRVYLLIKIFKSTVNRVSICKFSSNGQIKYMTRKDNRQEKKIIHGQFIDTPQHLVAQTQWTHLHRFAIDSTSKFHVESSWKLHRF